MSTLATGYDPTTFESRLYAQWESSGAFAPTGVGEPYTILLPPPNVTGTLHMGHAFQQTLMDALVRYHRMRGFDTLWQVGTDHAGIATEMVVSRNLAIEGKGETRDSLGREAFIERVWEWKAQSGDTIERQMRRLGTSADWSRSMFTMDPAAAEAVVEAFVRLHEEGLIYRGQRLVNWDPVLKTAISDLEVVNEEEDGHLWSISYPLADGSGALTVATTRPETMLGDTAVMVHPEDERYAHLVGKSVRLPLSEREIPIVADAYVDREFGTGVVKVTPAHDFNDYQVGQRHSLPLINIFTPEAKIKSTHFDDFQFVPVEGTQLAENTLVGKSVSEIIPERYHGLDRYEARKLVLADLETAGLLIETKPHKLQVPRGDRTGQVIEPFLTDQWFVRMENLAKRGMELVESGDVRFVPPNWINTYRHWMENIQDWCISRQLWWGHRIPAWYDMWSNIVVAHNRDEAYEKYFLDILDKHYTDDLTSEGLEKLRAIVLGSELSDVDLEDLLEASGFGKYALKQDSDVLETWFSSQLWPISTMGWPDPARMAERGFDRYVPSSVLVTGFDIIFFWVARMIMATDRLTGRVPFHDVYITGLVRDAHGQKMSKSKGNVLDPLDLIDGISLEALVAKRTTGLMKPTDAPKIEKATRREFPNGIPAFGADALRFTIAALAGHGRDIKFDLGRAEGYKNFCNKLWNATRFALMNVGDAARFEGAPSPRTDAEKWILAELDRTCAEAAAHFADYRFDLLAQALYEFAWNQFCDWFLELAKPALNGEDPAAADSTRHTLLYVLDALLRLLHPLAPFVTEELWQAVAPRLGKSGSIMTQPYPQAGDIDVASFGTAAADIEWLKDAISALRRIRSELGVSPAKQVSLLFRGGGAADAARIARFDAQLRFLCRLDRIDALAGEPPAAAPAVVGDLQLFVPLEGLVDLGAERARLDKEIAKVATEKGKSEAKLAKFGANVPPAVVEQERQRLADWTAKLEALSAQRARL